MEPQSSTEELVSGQPEQAVSGSLGEVSPEAIVLAAERFVASNLSKPITARAIAQAIGIKVSDLKACFRVMSQEDLASAILRMRIQALHAVIEQQPERSLEKLTAEVGLRLDQDLDDRFDQQFWMTPGRWQQICRNRLHLSRAR